MASDDVNIAEDTEMADYDGDKVVTMMDVLQEQQEFEDDANAVLGASDDKNCTYPKGYIKRQALYACLTCCTEAKLDPTKRAGVCLACSLTCHENHELIELYTKRNFRCDCGNPKFNNHPCQFTLTKADLNEDNIYNQNFSGLYCTCHRPYPDPDSTLEDDMIQCIICEDWLHASHLETMVPANDQYSEMVCKGCMEKNEFLHDYTRFAVNLENSEVDIITVNEEAKSADHNLCNGDLEKEKLVNSVDSIQTDTKATDDIKLNGDVEMNEDSKNSEESGKITENYTCDNNITSEPSEEIKVKESSKITENNTCDNNITSEHSEEIKVKKISDMESTESKDPELKQTETEEEQSKENSDQQVNKEDITIKTDEPNVTDDIVPGEQSGDKADLIEAAENEDKAPNTNEETCTTISETENMDIATKEHTTTEEQIKEQPTNVDQNSDNATKSSEKTEQLLDDDSALISDNLTSDKEKDVLSEEKSADAPDKANNVSGDSTQSEVLKENAVDKADSVMDAIDELLDAENSDLKQENKDEDSASADTKENTSDIKQVNKDEDSASTDTKENTSDIKQENKDEDSASTDTKENTESTVTKAPDDVGMTSIENKVNGNALECTEKTKEAEDKSGAAVEISDIAEQDKSQVMEHKIETKSVDTKKGESIAASDINTIDENKVVEETSNDEAKPSAKETTEIDTETSSTETEVKVKQTAENTTNESETKEDNYRDNEAADVKENSSEHKRKLSVDLSEDVSSKKAKLEAECVRPQGVKKVHKGATFWPSTFRQKLCTCGECISMYKDLNVLFLTDLEDTVSAYESLGKENSGGASQYEKGLEALSSLDRIQQINALTEYNKMRDKLLDFLKSFKDRKEIVKEEDIKAFFAGMKPRREPDGVYFCR